MAWFRAMSTHPGSFFPVLATAASQGNTSLLAAITQNAQAGVACDDAALFRDDAAPRLPSL